MALTLTAAALRVSFDGQLAINIVLVPVLVSLAVIDIEHRRVPNSLLVVLLSLMLTNRIIEGQNILSVASGLALGAAIGLMFLGFNWLMEFFAGMRVIGPGDAKLLAVASVGQTVWGFIVLVGLTGLFAVVFGLVWQAVRKEPEFPLSPSLALALWTMMLVPELASSFGG